MSYLVILGTNRDKPLSGIIAAEVNAILNEKQIEYKYLSLGDFDAGMYDAKMYVKKERSEDMDQFQESTLIAAKKWIIVMPEYNGSFPGVLKAFIDFMSLNRIKDTFHYKKALLIGVAAGRAGNLRGLDHLTGILNHMKVTVFPTKLPISRIEDFVDKEAYTLKDESIRTGLTKLIDEFIAF